MLQLETGGVKKQFRGRLGRRGNINLMLGFVTTMLALGVLAQLTFFVPLPQNLSNYGEIAIRYLPRLALAIFIQVFAFFFLRLYKTTLEEIKFFQNEMTNIELASISLETSNKAKDAPYIQELCKRLLEIESKSLVCLFAVWANEKERSERSHRSNHYCKGRPRQDQNVTQAGGGSTDRIGF